MSVHQPTLQALTEMGIEPDLARAAAKRFENADAAVNWCFGEGANVSINTLLGYRLGLIAAVDYTFRSAP